VSESEGVWGRTGLRMGAKLDAGEAGLSPVSAMASECYGLILPTTEKSLPNVGYNRAN
jgi:hypothetical protein